MFRRQEVSSIYPDFMSYISQMTLLNHDKNCMSLFALLLFSLYNILHFKKHYLLLFLFNLREILCGTEEKHCYFFHIK